MIYKRILVAVDDSETSNIAMQEAIKLAKDQQATLHIVHVVDEFILAEGGTAIDFEKYESMLRAAGQSILNKMEQIAREAGISFKTHLIEIIEYEDHIPEKIIEKANKHHADLIVIGTHGRRGVRRFLLGSVAEGVIRMASIPVLLIHGKQEDK